MNKWIYKSLLALFCMGMVACSDDDNVDVSSALWDISESVVSFGAEGGDGFIRMDTASGDAEAVSNAEWCVIKEAGKEQISFFVEQNEHLTNRTATIQIKMGADARQVSISQQGLIVEYDYQNNLYMAADNAAIDQEILFRSSLPVEITIGGGTESWLDYMPTENGYRFKADANKPGGGRMETVTFCTGKLKQTAYFFQYDKEYLLGDWGLEYVDETGTPREDLLTIKFDPEDNDTLLLNFEELHLLYDIKSVYRNGIVKTHCGQHLDMVGLLNVVFFGAESVDGDLTIDKEMTCNLYPFADEDGSWGFEYRDDGSWPGMTVKGPVLLKVSPLSGAASYHRALFGWRMKKKPVEP